MAITSTQSSNTNEGLRWLRGQLEWEAALDNLRNPNPVEPTQLHVPATTTRTAQPTAA